MKRFFSLPLLFLTLLFLNKCNAQSCTTLENSGCSLDDEYFNGTRTKTCRSLIIFLETQICSYDVEEAYNFCITERTIRSTLSQEAAQAECTIWFEACCTENNAEEEEIDIVRIVGIVIGSVLGVALLVSGGVYLYYKNRDSIDDL